MNEAAAGGPAPRRAFRALLEHRAIESMTALWWFPPLQRGRLESGLLAAALRHPEEPSGDAQEEGPPQRILVTLAWTLRETGQGPVFEAQFREEGEAPADRLPRILGGVARRMDEGLGDPRYLETVEDPSALHAWIEELEP